MKKTLIAATLTLLALPAVALAAYNDVTLTSSTVLSVNGIEVDVSGSDTTLQSIDVGATSFTMVMQSGSTAVLTAPNYNQLNVSTDQGINSDITCTSSNSTVTLTSGGNVVVTITPSSSLCPLSLTSESTSSGGGNGPIVSSGGGGGGAVVTAIIPSYPSSDSSASSANANTSAAAAASGSASGSFAPLTIGALKVGGVNKQVKTLQQMLNADPDTMVAASGPGSIGKETTKFGSATQAALKKFQKKWGLVSSGSPSTTGYGALGPKTRAKLNALYGKM